VKKYVRTHKMDCKRIFKWPSS